MSGSETSKNLPRKRRACSSAATSRSFGVPRAPATKPSTHVSKAQSLPRGRLPRNQGPTRARATTSDCFRGLSSAATAIEPQSGAAPATKSSTHMSKVLRLPRQALTGPKCCTCTKPARPLNPSLACSKGIGTRMPKVLRLPRNRGPHWRARTSFWGLLLKHMSKVLHMPQNQHSDVAPTTKAEAHGQPAA